MLFSICFTGHFNVCSWQIRSHAQKYFLKVQKNGTSEHVPPPRPKRKAAHPYPQKVPKDGQYGQHSISSVFFIFIFCNSWSWIDTQLLVHLLQLLLYPKLLDHFNLHLPCLNLVIRTDQIQHQCLEIQLPLQLCLPGVTTLCRLSLCLKWLKVLIVSTLLLPPFYFLSSLKSIITYGSHMVLDDAVLAGPTIAHNSCYSSSNESTPRTWSFGETIDRGDHGKQSRG